MVSPVAAGFVLYTGQQWAVILIALAIGIALKVFVVTWILRDVRRVGRPTRPWLIAAILADLPTLIVWLIVRPKRARAPAARAAPTPEPESFGAPPSVEAPRAYRVAQTPTAPPGPAPMPAAEAAASLQAVRISCPRCGERFVAQKAAHGPTSVTCPKCGASGRV